MSGKTKAKIFSSPDKCMMKVELRRLRKLAGFSQGELADKLKDWGWYKNKVVRLESKKARTVKVGNTKIKISKSKYFCLDPLEMQAILDALGAVSI